VDSLRFGGQVFKHFSTTPIAEVIQVTGEFTWRVKRGETNRVVDYVAPPLMLSSEATGNDLNWSQGCYARRRALPPPSNCPMPCPSRSAFTPTSPTRGRIPRAASGRCSSSWPWSPSWSSPSSFHVQRKALLRQDFTFEPRSSDEVQSGEFTLAGKQRKLAVRQSTSLDNNWIGLDLLLVNKTTASLAGGARTGLLLGLRRRPADRRQPRRRGGFRQYPGRHLLPDARPDMAPDKNVAVRDRLEVLTPRAGWSNFIIVMLFLAAFPILPPCARRRSRHGAGRKAITRR
jgi:hypothetical protein